MSLRHCYCVPRGSETSPSTLATKDLLTKVEANLSIPFETKIFDDDSDHKEKLIHISVRYGLRLPQTSRSKELRYAHIVLCDGDEPLVFYPQIRRGRQGKLREVSIQKYLASLLEGNIKSLVEVPALKPYAGRQFELLREGYLELAKEALAYNKEWETADSEWPQ